MTAITITVLLLIILGCLIYILVLKYFKKYTRERFAFFIVSGMVTLGSSFLIQIYSSQGYVSALIKTSNIIFETKFSLYQTDIKDHVITLILLIMLMRFMLRLHKNWDGPISENQFDKQRFQYNPTVLSEAILQLKDFVSKEKIIVPHVEKEKEKTFNIFMHTEDDKTPWHENVFELLTFSNPQYKIDLLKDYYPDEKCFISKYGQADERIVVFCTIDYPNESTIRNFINFAKRQKKEFSKFIIAIKKHTGIIEIINKYETEIIIRNESEMLFSLIDFTSYKQFIQDQFSNKEITIGSSYTLKDIYVPLKGRNDKEEYPGKIEEYVFKWLRYSNENKHLAILGEYGCGKSVLSLKLTYELLENRTKDDRIPILVELRGKSPRNLSVIEILSTWASNYRIDVASLMKLHKAGKLLIIFEGFDEMDMIGDREMRLSHFQRIWEFAIPNSKIIITGRPNFFLDDKELKVNLGIDKPYDMSHYCEAIYLEKFDEEQIKLALRNIDENTREQVIEILENSGNSNFYDLVSRPAILYLVAVIWKERKLSQMKDNINSAIVISEFIKYSYSRQSTKKIPFPLTEKEREYFMLGIAVSMLWTTGFSNQINKSNLENIILKLYKNFPIEITASENALQPQRKHLKDRMIDNSLAEETILTDVRSCGILVNDLTRKDYFKFAHKSFLEYQVSLYFVESLLQDKGTYNIMMNAITSALEINVSRFKHSQETISFTSEILISKLHLNKSDDSHKLCKKLFGILYPNKFLGKHPYLTAFSEMHLPSSFVSYSLLGALTSSALLTLFHRITIKSSTLMMLFPIFVFFCFAFIFARISSVNNKRTIIWLKCCKQLNISDDILTKVVPKRYVLFLKGEKIKDPIFLLLKALFGNLGKERN
jgi:hypothetical protein